MYHKPHNYQLTKQINNTETQEQLSLSVPTKTQLNFLAFCLKPKAKITLWNNDHRVLVLSPAAVQSNKRVNVNFLENVQMKKCHKAPGKQVTYRRLGIKFRSIFLATNFTFRVKPRSKGESDARCNQCHVKQG